MRESYPSLSLNAFQGRASAKFGQQLRGRSRDKASVTISKTDSSFNEMERTPARKKVYLLSEVETLFYLEAGEVLVPLGLLLGPSH
jgi:hypothetical protein